MAGKLSSLREDGHPERAALIYGETRGQKRSFLERFMAAVGSPNAVSHDSLNIEAAKLGTLFTQGIYDLPAYDLENSNYVLSFGASFLEAGRSPQRMVSGYQLFTTRASGPGQSCRHRSAPGRDRRQSRRVDTHQAWHRWSTGLGHCQCHH